jgi:hypothetical protein
MERVGNKDRCPGSQGDLRNRDSSSPGNNQFRTLKSLGNIVDKRKDLS